MPPRRDCLPRMEQDSRRTHPPSRFEVRAAHGLAVERRTGVPRRPHFGRALHLLGRHPRGGRAGGAAHPRRLLHLRLARGSPKVENTIHAGQDMILGHQLIERAGNEQFQLIATLASQHLVASQNRTQNKDTENHACQAFSTAPRSASCSDTATSRPPHATLTLPRKLRNTGPSPDPVAVERARRQAQMGRRLACVQIDGLGHRLLLACPERRSGPPAGGLRLIRLCYAALHALISMGLRLNEEVEGMASLPRRPVDQPTRVTRSAWMK